MKNVTYINAGAGSGKTYTLTKILSEKLSGFDGNGNRIPTVKPSEVILTTFTELAASEFREKARKKVLDVKNFDAAAQIDSAAIGTVHSVALQFIKKFWYLLDYGADIQTITERDEDFYMSQSLSRIVSERDQNGDLKKQRELNIFREVRDYFNICDAYSHPDYLYWQRYLRDIVEKMDYYNVDDVQESISKNIQTLKSIFTGAALTQQLKNELLAYLQKYYDYAGTATTKTAQDQRNAIEPFLKNCQDIKELAVLISPLKSPVGGNTKIENNCPGYGDFMEKLNGISISTDNLDILIPFVEAIFPLAKEWRDDYKAYKEQKHLISFDDMERLFLKLITNEQEVIDYIKDNYKLVMVDEFQDSNPIQLKIFNRLSEIIAQNDGHSYWVGDPKQAIYGFRGADTDLVNSVSKHFKFYNDAKIHPEEGPNNLGSGRLVESWRSRAVLVNLVNDIFKDKFAGEIDPLCITLNPHFTSDDLTSPALVHWTNIKDGRQQTFQPEALASNVKDLLASQIEVHREERDKPKDIIRPKDIAILCRKNDTCSNIVKALRKYDIPVSESESNIMQRIEVQLVVSLLQFIQNPSNKHVIADLMRLLWGKTTKDILQDRINYVWEKTKDGMGFEHLDADLKLKNDEWQSSDAQVVEEIKKLTQLTDRFKHLSIPEMVRALIYECNLPALTARWDDQRVRQQNLSTVQHLADDYDQMCLQMGLGTSISGFIFYLNSTEPDKEKDNQSDTVKVFTYHGSKGLEWPVVILTELKTDSLDDNELVKKSFMKVREIVARDNASKQDPFDKDYYIHLFPNILKSKENPPAPMLDNIKQLPLFNDLKVRTCGEEKRLLYVGMTRAKDYLYTTALSTDIDKGNLKWLIGIGIIPTDNKNVWGVAGYSNQLLEKGDITAVPTTAKGNYTMVEKPQMHNVFGKRYLSPSKIETFQGFTKSQEWGEDGTDIPTNGWGNDYATIGSCIHDIFAAYRKGADDDNRKAAINTIAGYGVTDKLSGHVDAIIRSADWLYETLQAKFPQKDGDTIDKELPFMMTLPDGSTLRGDMDLLWFYTDDKGQHCILIDYKTYHGVNLYEYSKSKCAQLSAYKAALDKAGIDVTHTLIYYPVYAKVHELI